MKRWEKFVGFAFVLAIITFILGFLFSTYIYFLKFQEYRIFTEHLMASLVGLDSVKKMDLDLCDLKEHEIFEDKVKLGRMLEALESRRGKEDKEILSLKEIYEIIEIKTLNLLREIEDKCEKNFTIVLFFYSNFKNSTLSIDQGLILDTLVKEFENEGQNIYVFAFSIETNNPTSKFLRKRYNITQVPSIVVNNITLKGFQRKDYLKKLLLENINK